MPVQPSFPHFGPAFWPPPVGSSLRYWSWGDGHEHLTLKVVRHLDNGRIEAAYSYAPQTPMRYGLESFAPIEEWFFVGEKKPERKKTGFAKFIRKIEHDGI